MKSFWAFLLSVGSVAAQIDPAGYYQDPNYVSPHSFEYPPLKPNWPTEAPRDGATYDYIVVGSGPGGSPLAARLALAGHSVLLVDAGEDHHHDRQVTVPAFHPLAEAYNPIKWDYFVGHYDDPAQAARDSKMTYRTPDGRWYTGLSPPDGSEMLGVLYPRTGALGGCSEHNALLAVYPRRSDWNHIADVTGDHSWDADNMRAHFRRLERCRYLPNSVAGHGFSGWLQTQLMQPTLVLQDRRLISLIVAACSAMGRTVLSGVVSSVTGLLSMLALDVNNDLPGRDSAEEIYQMPVTVHGSEYTRLSSRDFVVDVAAATNPDGSRKYRLDIALNTLVTRVTFDDNSAGIPRANGVDYLFGRSMYRADARSAGVPDGPAGHVAAAKEVIVSAGAFNSPQLLKLSGIGPATELARFGIPLVKDLPGVGGNLQDRYEMGVVGVADTPYAQLKDCKFVREGEPDPCFERWKDMSGAAKGSLTTNGLAFGIFARSSQSEGETDLFVGGIPINFPGFYPEFMEEAIRGGNAWTWLIIKTSSRNRAGSVNLTSADPRDVPRIDFRSFQQGGDQDLQAVLEGLGYAFRAFDALVPLDGSFERVWPPRNLTTDDELKQFIRDEAWGHHASCTCPIGADDDPHAVLDSKFRVRGVDGLRVVDASVFPRIPGSFIMLPIYMISEKAAETILEDREEEEWSEKEL